MSTPTFINVASLVPDQHHCNLKLRVLSVETIAETIHPETGKIIQSAEAIVGDDTACILLNLKNDQVNLLARNASLRILNANVNMYRGFMRLEVNEDDEGSNSSSSNGEWEHERPSITAIMDEDDEDNQNSTLSRDGDKMVAATTLTSANHPRSIVAQAAHAAAAQTGQAAAAVSSSSAARPAGLSLYNTGGVMTPVVAVSSSMPTGTTASGSSFNSLASTTSSSSSSSSSRDQMEVEMRLGTGGSVPLMEYYRTIEFTYFSTVEPVGR
ncbi:hypothetical protein BG015_000328 [Linnemannia schmuckeri]|uniref:Single-stranded DNA binding protein Ssb-like OB fold domain-containing protein n=1 Tax=Linnemannia schmuckeri TaxID=64567 RepID=A0A9P5VE43_9FUNG|nr:hypothetical protein BG015_000328 [Linnemannia schmuckeri]